MKLKKIFMTLLSTVLIITNSVSVYAAEDNYSGLKQENNQWVYYENGAPNTEKTGLVLFDNEWFYVEDGLMNTKKAGFVEYDGEKFYVAAGRLVSERNGIVPFNDNWYFVAAGRYVQEFTGMSEYDNAWFVLENGILNLNYNDLYDYDGGKFLVAAGQIKSDYSGLFQAPDNNWYFIANGQVCTDYSGLALYDNQWFYVEKGVLQPTFTGWVDYNGGSFYVVNGMVQQTTTQKPETEEPSTPKPDKVNHYYKSVITAPTCTEKGYTTHTCACGASYIDSYTDATGHSWNEWTITKEATEVETGTKERTCSSCSIKETDTIAKKEHSHAYSAVVTAPTCTEKGYTTHTCSCGNSYIDTYTDATNHLWGAWETTKEATETETGLKERVCTNCSSKETDTIALKEHKHSYTTVVTAPTCIAQGYTTHTCSCGDSYVDTYTDTVDHTWGEWSVTKDPGTAAHTTIDEFGERTKTCQTCTESKTETIINIDASAYDETDYTFIPKENANFISDNVIQVYGVFCDDMAYETLAMVNELRTSLGLNELKWAVNFADIGKIRSVEATIRYSHKRPNGHATAYTTSTGLKVSLAENLAGNDYSASEVFNAWCNSEGHYNNITKSKYTNYYAACFVTDYGAYGWIQLFY